MRPFCKKCFFSELDPGGVYNEIKDMIAALPEESGQTMTHTAIGWTSVAAAKVWAAAYAENAAALWS